MRTLKIADEAKLTSDVSADEYDKPFLYQAGYLTIKSYNKKPEFYTLAYPNKEVMYDFLSNLFPYYIARSAFDKDKMEIWHFYEEIQAGDVNAFMRRMQAIFTKCGKDATTRSAVFFRDKCNVTEWKICE